MYEISHHLHTFSSQYKYAKWDTAILQMWDIGLKVKSLQLSADLDVLCWEPERNVQVWKTDVHLPINMNPEKHKSFDDVVS